MGTICQTWTTRTWSICWLTILASIAMVAASWAALPDEQLRRAERLFDGGDFIAAARIAESVPSVRGQTLAARATLAVADYAAVPADRLGVYGEAARLARNAIEYDAGKAEAYRYLVIALGHIARSRSPLEAFLEGYADEGRRLIDLAMTLEPESPWTYALLGAWHAEIVAAAGSVLADYLFEASADQAVAAFETAIRLEPDNPILRFEYGLALVRLGGSDADAAAAAREQFTAAVKMIPRNAVETIVITRARRTLEAPSAGESEKAGEGEKTREGEKAMERGTFETGDESP